MARCGTKRLTMDKANPVPSAKCKYFTAGCTESVFETEISAHEDTCPHRIYNCPSAALYCHWKGTMADIVPHLTSVHLLNTMQGESVGLGSKDINCPGNVHWAVMQSCFGNHFMVVLWKCEEHDVKQFYAAVLLIGSKNQAENFNYKLELIRGRRRLSWEGIPLSLDHPVRPSQIETDCLMFDLDKAFLFVENGVLDLTSTVTMLNTPSQ